MPPWFLKENVQEISKVLTDIYQDCIDTGTVPIQWKHANVCAIHKKGKKSDPSNYRPVSLTCIASKVLEHIVHSRVMKHLSKYGVLTDYQHGFWAKRSTETQLIWIIHEKRVLSSPTKQFTPQSSIFQKYLTKFPIADFWRNLIITEFLAHYIIGGGSSAPVVTTFGVPQGTALGPLLFLMHINDLPDGLNSTVRLLLTMRCYMGQFNWCDEDTADLQDDLYRLEDWQQRWQMEFNPSRCKIMGFTTRRDPPMREYVFCGEILEEVGCHPFFGGSAR